MTPACHQEWRHYRVFLDRAGRVCGGAIIPAKDTLAVTQRQLSMRSGSFRAAGIGHRCCHRPGGVSARDLASKRSRAGSAKDHRHGHSRTACHALDMDSGSAGSPFPHRSGEGASPGAGFAPVSCQALARRVECHGSALRWPFLPSIVRCCPPSAAAGTNTAPQSACIGAQYRSRACVSALHIWEPV